ncbi:hypothetical protein HNP72_001268 [Sphingobacterium soli]|nr:hypothetical protein [Sphingobacterium soli]
MIFDGFQSRALNYLLNKAFNVLRHQFLFLTPESLYPYQLKTELFLQSFIIKFYSFLLMICPLFQLGRQKAYQVMTIFFDKLICFFNVERE